MRGGLARALAVCTLLGCACGDNHWQAPAWGIGVTQLAVGPDPQCSDQAQALLDGILPNPHLVLPTYEHSGHAVHPDVLFRPDATPYPFVMAVTPYRNTRGTTENPSVFVSRDGNIWEVPPGGPNPIVMAPRGGYNNDPDLLFDVRSAEYRLYYQETVKPSYQAVKLARSRDLRSWQVSTVMHMAQPDATTGLTLSPSVVWVADHYEMFVMVFGGTIWRGASADGLAWSWAQFAPIALDAGAVQPWHLDVQWSPLDGFTMLLAGYVGATYLPQALYWGQSRDGHEWRVAPVPLLRAEDLDVDVPPASLYRGTAVRCQRTQVWYSYRY